MIQAVTTPEQQAEYRRRISGKPYFEAVLGTHLALFGAHPASGWMFYLLPGTSGAPAATASGMTAATSLRKSLPAAWGPRPPSSAPSS